MIGTSASTVGPNGGEELTTLPFDRISIETGETPSNEELQVPAGGEERLHRYRLAYTFGAEADDTAC